MTENGKIKRQNGGQRGGGILVDGSVQQGAWERAAIGSVSERRRLPLGSVRRTGTEAAELRGDRDTGGITLSFGSEVRERRKAEGSQGAAFAAGGD
ncbi:hypothetical protein ACFXTH_000017 [Malus domestica]